MALKHGNQLPVQRCPHCNIAQPLVNRVWNTDTKNFRGGTPRKWGVYNCATCGGLILAVAPGVTQNADIAEMWPAPDAVADELPARAKEYLSQAISSIHAPVGAVVTAASAVDAMLKSKGYKEGTLYSRIDHAARDHVITPDMAAWAHEVRLDANDQRHADEAAELPTSDDAMRVIEFAKALGQFLFVLPARVERGRKAGS